MARAGFFYTQREDIVQCFNCNARLGQWKTSDDPLAEHLRWSGHCVYAKLLATTTGYDTIY